MATKGDVPGGVSCFSPAVEAALDTISAAIRDKCKPELVRWYAIKLFERDADAIKALELSSDELASLEDRIASVEKERDDDSESIITSDRYARWAVCW